MGMVRKGVDHPTVLYRPAVTGMNHPLKFSLKRPEALYSMVHLIQVFLRNRINLCTRLLRVVGQLQQLSDLCLGEPQLPAVPDKRQPRQMLLTIDTLISCRAPRLR